MRNEADVQRGLLAAVLTFVLALMAAVPAAAAPPPDGQLVPASGRLAGLTGGQLLGEELRQLFELPVAQNPFAGNGGSCFGTGNKDKVLIVWTRPTPDTCTVKPGTPIFLFTYVGSCSNTEQPPSFGGETEAGQRSCALALLKQPGVPSAIRVSIDGRPPVDIKSDRYLAVSPQVTVNLPNPNILGVPTSPPTTFVAAAWVAMIRPLPPGTHTIRVESVTNGMSSVSAVIVEVVPGA
jgi:hypothetical protein